MKEVDLEVLKYWASWLIGSLKATDERWPDLFELQTVEISQGQDCLQIRYQVGQEWRCGELPTLEEARLMVDKAHQFMNSL